MQHIIGKHGQIWELKDGTFKVQLKVNSKTIKFTKKDLPKYIRAIEPTHNASGQIVIHSGWFGENDSE